MSRIIFFVLIVAVIYFAWRSMRLKQIQLEKRLDKQEKANLAEHKNDMPGEKMVSCVGGQGLQDRGLQHSDVQ